MNQPQAGGAVRLYGRLERWALSRDWRLSLQGLPALVLGVGICVLFVVAWETRGSRLRWYQAQASTAFQAKDDARARICNERLLSSAFNRQEAQYRIALLAERQGQPA